ncbi:MAG: aminodeoxychorismate lyase [Verrucomicrobiota bacterium]
MIVFINGRFVPKEKAVVSVFDRGFLYGDGLFETIRVFHGHPFRWEQHLDRLRRGARLLKLEVPYSPGEMRLIAAHLIELNAQPESVLRINVTRGVGPRGYSTKSANSPTLVLSLHPAPPSQTKPTAWRLVTSRLRLAAGPLAQWKTANRLVQIMARMEADAAQTDEALLLNANDEVVECSSANLFWARGREVFTAPVEAGALEGVTRQVVFEACRKLKVPCRERTTKLAALKATDGVFATLSTLGIVEISEIDGAKLKRSSVVRKLHNAYWRMVMDETWGNLVRSPGFSRPRVAIK